MVSYPEYMCKLNAHYEQIDPRNGEGNSVPEVDSIVMCMVKVHSERIGHRNGVFTSFRGSIIMHIYFAHVFGVIDGAGLVGPARLRRTVGGELSAQTRIILIQTGWYAHYSAINAARPQFPNGLYMLCTRMELLQETQRMFSSLVIVLASMGIHCVGI